MRSIESEADTIDEAIGKALETLRVSRDQVEVEILSDATKGLFGFGGTKARVRATVRAPLFTHVADERPPVPGDVSRETSGPGQNVSRETSAMSRNVSRETPGASRSVSRETLPRGPSVSRETSGAPTEAFRERARAVLSDLLGHLGAQCTVDARPADDPGALVLAVNGDSGGLLIGRRGQTLDALEYIVNRIVARDDGAPFRVIVDVERYRERRQEYLTTLANRLADKVRQTGRVVTLNPMSPRDRRIVHLALQGDASVATRSQGDGHYRRVLIVPADRPRRSRPAGRPTA